MMICFLPVLAERAFVYSYVYCGVCGRNWKTLMVGCSDVLGVCKSDRSWCKQSSDNDIYLRGVNTENLYAANDSL